MGHFSVEIMRLPGQLSVEINTQVRDRVLRDFLANKIAHLQQGNERFLRRRAEVKIAADLR